MIDAVKLAGATGLSCLVAYFEPLRSAMFVLMFVFFLDMIIAIYADIVVNRKDFKPKKFLTAFFYVAIYLMIIVCVYIVGERMGDAEESLYVDKIVTYIFIYFYIVNILKNLRIIVPENRPIAFLEFTFGLEFLKRIPNLDEFIRHENKHKTKPEE